jgi:phage terminase large subunit
MSNPAPKYKFKKEWFNPLYFAIKQLVDGGVSEFYIYGGKSSSKTFSVCQFIGIRCFIDKDDALIFRKESTVIKTTIKRTFSDALDSTRMTNAYEKRDFSFIIPSSSNEVIFKGLDSDEKAKGVQSYSYVLMDELNHFSKDEYDQLTLSFRGEKAKVFFGTWNPVSDQSWIKKDLIDKDIWHDYDGFTLPSKDSFIRINEKCNRALIKTDYKDNYWVVGAPDSSFGFVDQKLIDKYENLRITDFASYDVNVLGNWGTIKVGNPYILNINKSANGTNTTFKKFTGVVFSFDFNVKNSVTVWQKYQTREGWFVSCIEEIHIGGDEDSDLQHICKKLADKYKGYSIEFSGDASGNNRSALTQANMSAFSIIQLNLRKFGCKHLTYVRLKGNPRTKACRFVVNEISKYLGKNLQIDYNCSVLWSDIESVPINAFGDIDKKYCDKNDIGHVLDTMRYFFWVFCFDIWEDIIETIHIPTEYRNLKQNVEFELIS